MSSTFAVYHLSPIGVNGGYEADGEVHYFCSHDCATASDYRNVNEYTDPEPTTDALPGTVCENCLKVIL